MKKTALLILTYCCIHFFSNAQERYVVANAGDYYVKSTCSISWTLGEVIIGYVTKSTCSMSQGFQQGNIIVEEIPSSIAIAKESGIRIFPNPASEYFTIQMDEFNSESIAVLYSLTGQELQRKILTGFSTNFNLSEIKSGTYLLKITNRQKNISETYKIIKF